MFNHSDSFTDVIDYIMHINRYNVWMYALWFLKSIHHIHIVSVHENGVYVQRSIRFILCNTSSSSSGIVTIGTARWYEKSAPYLVTVIINYTRLTSQPTMK